MPFPATLAVMHVSRIRIFPVKSLDGVDVAVTDITSLGALRHDREWALVDSQDRFVTAKRRPALHAIRCAFSSDFRQISVAASGSSPATLPLDPPDELQDWFTKVLGENVRLIRDSEQGFPDDLRAEGPTVIGESTLKEVAGWFSIDLENARCRFRTNVEISGSPPFWEDRLFGTPGEPVDFQLDDVRFQGINPCGRCAVPARDPGTGAPDPGFQKTFMANRSNSLPDWSDRSRFDHFYRLAVNTRIPAGQVGKRLRLGASLLFDRLAP